MRIGACIDELVKLGMITPEHAEASLERLQSLEDNKPTVGQALRYGALGALVGPLATGVGDVVKGRPIFTPAERGGKVIPFGRARGGLSAAAVGALTGGALPFLRNRLDQSAEKRTLRQFMNEYEAGSKQAQAMPGGLAEKANKTFSDFPAKKLDEGESVEHEHTKSHQLARSIAMDHLTEDRGYYKKLKDVEDKTAEDKKKEKDGDFSASYDPGNFRVSPYSGPLSYGPWILPSMLNGGDEQPLDVTVERKKSAGALTPVGATPQAKLTSAQNIAQPKVSGPSAPGGSIADVAKPRGYGMPIPGALKGTI